MLNKFSLLTKKLSELTDLNDSPSSHLSLKILLGKKKKENIVRVTSKIMQV